jgi:hypothetical protein
MLKPHSRFRSAQRVWDRASERASPQDITCVTRYFRSNPNTIELPRRQHSRPRRMTVSNNLTEVTITCSSCEYCYPASGGICPMCGTEPLRPLSITLRKSSRASHRVRPQSSDRQQRLPGPRIWRLIPVVALIVLMAVASFFYQTRKSNLAKESGSPAQLRAPSEQIKIESASEPIVHEPVGVEHEVVAEKLGTGLTAASEQTKVESAAERHIVPPAARRVQQIAATKPATAAGDTAKVDPVELWKAVKRGSVNAEVALARLYLEGEAVPQNCDQAHMLLSVASTKGSKAADTLLKSSYAERCP